MKIKFLFILFILPVNSIFSQWLGGASSTASIYRPGNVGIGMSAAPSYQFVVNNPTSGNGPRILFGGTSIASSIDIASSLLEIQSNYASAGSWVGLYSGASPNRKSIMIGITDLFGASFTVGKSGSAAYSDLSFSVGGSTSMIIKTNGQIVIGSPSSTPTPYKLFVTGGILTEKLKVAISGTADWSDYVFAEDYTLMPIYFLEKYITENNHLPGVPSAEEMVNIGNDVAKTDAILLAKIEELTLYMIAQQKQELVSLKRESIFLV